MACILKTWWHRLVRPKRPDYVRNYDMAKQEDDDNFEFGENRGINNLARAIREHADAVLRLVCQAQTNGVTKEDLAAAEARLIKAILESRPTKPRVRLDFSIGLPSNKETQSTTMDIKLTNEQKVTVTLSPKTDTGKPAKLDGSPSWTVTSGNSTLVIAEDGMSADVISSDDPGDTEIIVKADADLGEGIEEISEILRVSVSSAGAKNLGITVGPPEAKDEPTPV